MDRFPFDPYDFFGYLASGLLIIAGMDIVLGFPTVLGQDLQAVDTALLVLAIYIAGQLVATPAKAVLEDGIVDKLLGRPSMNLLCKTKPAPRFLFPGFFTTLPEPISERILAQAEKEGIRGGGEALFLHIRFHPQILANEKLMAKLKTFLNKYGFARNLAFTSIVVGVAVLVKYRVSSDTIDPQLARYGWTALVAGVLLFYRYLKFFRQYSYEMFNTYAGLKLPASATQD